MAEIFFPSLANALPEPDAGLPVQTDQTLVSAFEGLLSGTTAIADSYTGLQHARNKTEAAARNLDALERPQEAAFLREQGAAAFANPFNPSQNEGLIESANRLFSDTTKQVRDENARLELQRRRDEAAASRQAAGIQGQKDLASFNRDTRVILGSQDFGHRFALQGQQGQIRSELQEADQTFRAEQGDLDRASALERTEVAQEGADRRAYLSNATDVYQSNLRASGGGATQDFATRTQNDLANAIADGVVDFDSDSDTHGALLAKVTDLVAPNDTTLTGILGDRAEAKAAMLAQANTSSDEFKAALKKFNQASDEIQEFSRAIFGRYTEIRSGQVSTPQSTTQPGITLPGLGLGGTAPTGPSATLIQPPGAGAPPFTSPGGNQALDTLNTLGNNN